LSKSLITYLLHRPTWQKLPRLPRMYSVEFAPREVDEDTSTLMKMSHTRCPQGVEILKQRHSKTSARQLIRSLPPARRARQIRRRLQGLICGAFGVTTYDPALTLYRQEKPSKRRL
jgi:hypothetical protein